MSSGHSAANTSSSSLNTLWSSGLDPTDQTCLLTSLPFFQSATATYGLADTLTHFNTWWENEPTRRRRFKKTTASQLPSKNEVVRPVSAGPIQPSPAGPVAPLAGTTWTSNLQRTMPKQILGTPTIPRKYLGVVIPRVPGSICRGESDLRRHDCFAPYRCRLSHHPSHSKIGPARTTISPDGQEVFLVIACTGSQPSAAFHGKKAGHFPLSL